MKDLGVCIIEDKEPVRWWLRKRLSFWPCPKVNSMIYGTATEDSDCVDIRQRLTISIQNPFAYTEYKH